MKNIFKILIFICLLPSIAVAANKTSYINTSCANDGNGTSASCAGSPGGAGAWNSCANMVTGEVAANADLVSMNGILTVNASGTTAETAACTINGFTTDSTHYLKLVGNFTGGVWSTSYYRFDSTFSSGAIIVHDQHVEIWNVQVNNAGTGSGNYYGIKDDQGAGGLSLKVFNSLFRGSTGTDFTGCIFFRPDVANAVGVFVNNICYGYTGAQAIGYQLDGSGYNDGETIIAYNNTCHGSPICFATHGGGSSDAQYLKNNAAQSCTTCYGLDAASSHTTSTTATNLSEDTTSPESGLRSKVMTFVSETGGSEDLHITSGDTVAKDAGTNLSGDAQYAFSTDIDGATRTGTWDIGADEYTAGGGGGASTISVLKALGEI